MEFPEYTSFYCPPQCPGVERFKADITARSFPPHAHEGFVIGIVGRGVKLLQHGGQQHPVSAGSVVFLNPDELHGVCVGHETGVAYQTLHVPAEIFQEVSGTAFRFARLVEHDPAWVVQLKDAFESLDDPSTAAGVWFERLSGIVVDLVNRSACVAAGTHAPLDDRLRRLVEYIGNHIAGPLSLMSLAREVDLSPQHLVRSFKQGMGVTPHTYIQARRTALAKQLLLTSQPAEAAASAGFADQSHLTRWMKACYGTTPAVYRKSMEAACR